MYWAMVRLGLPALWLLLRMYLRRSPGARRTVRRLWRRVYAPEDPAAPAAPLLKPLAEGLFEVVPAALGQTSTPGGHADDAEAPITIVHLLGSGEIAYSPLPGLRAMCALDPEIARHRHVILDTPHAPGAFFGPLEFASRAFHGLRPLLQDPTTGPLLLLGLSRGAIAAIELAFRAVDRTGKPTAAVALSPPTRGDIPWPASVRDVGLLEPGADATIRLPLPKPLRIFRHAGFLRAYVRVTGAMYHELNIDDDGTLDLLARYLRQSRPTETCLRALREYALLARVSDAELRQAYAGFAERAAGDGRVHLSLCWGEGDVWMPHAACRQRIQDLIDRHRVPPERLQLHTLPGWNHCVGRQLDQDFQPIVSMIGTACRFLRQPAPCEGTTADDG